MLVSVPVPVSFPAPLSLFVNISLSLYPYPAPPSPDIPPSPSVFSPLLLSRLTPCQTLNPSVFYLPFSLFSCFSQGRPHEEAQAAEEGCVSESRWKERRTTRAQHALLVRLPPYTPPLASLHILLSKSFPLFYMNLGVKYKGTFLTASRCKRGLCFGSDRCFFFAVHTRTFLLRSTSPSLRERASYPFTCT